MNDFTKEELEHLKFYVQVVDGQWKRDGHRALMNKIQSMIDNYCCGHEHSYTHQVVRNVCTKCGALFK